MPIDESIDYGLNYILRIFSPATLGILMAYYYNRVTNATEPYIEQVKKTVDAVRSSFRGSGILCFYDGVPIPVNLGNTIGCNDSCDSVAEKPHWYYMSDSKIFTGSIADCNSVAADCKRISWLSADIICDGKKVADITDFVSALRYKGTLPPTPDVLLSLWCFNQQYLLRRAHTQLVVICNEADTHSFNFSPIPNPLQDEQWLRSLGIKTTTLHT
jgi:hypothetical protein